MGALELVERVLVGQRGGQEIFFSILLRVSLLVLVWTLSSSPIPRLGLSE